MRMLGWVLACAPVLAGGCASTKSVAVGSRSFAPRAADHPIAVYLPVDAPVGVHEAAGEVLDPDQLPGAAVVIGRVDCSGGPLDGWGRVLESAKTRARAMGGDALVMHHWEHGGMGMMMCVPVGGEKKLSMRVVRFEE